MTRRIKDAEAGVNPNSLDCCLDISLPKMFDAVYFGAYAAASGTVVTPNMRVQYDQRLKVYQGFRPPSRIRMFFKFSTIDQLSEVLRLGSEAGLGRDWQALAVRQSRRLSLQMAQQFDAFSLEELRAQFSSVLRLSEEQKKVFAFVQSNYSVLLPEADL